MAEKKRRKKGKANRLYTPQEIVQYYQKKGKLPPEIRKRIEK
ncbi:unnamed protein product [marine sediment metagenome]|uniref:Uncharacterized protein n=1 Tax=marine sediment metagenome TaxID=412755 RepID=X0U731_9ZZZZ